MPFLQKTPHLPIISSRRFIILIFGFIALIVTSCTHIQQPAAEPFFAVSPPPLKQEFRWSNGKMPKSLDPARAAAAPETDVVRAIFEGLTEIDSKTLEAVPAVAEKWTTSDDKRVWTFQLRKDARWSNGKHVTADDFVISWKRLASLGDKTAHRELIQNIIGLKTQKPGLVPPAIDSSDFQRAPAKVPETTLHNETGGTNLGGKLQRAHTPDAPDEPVVRHDEADRPNQVEPVTAKKIGVESVGGSTLKVTLELPDKDFPKLAASPIFRPVYGDGAEFESDPLDSGVVTNGAFTVADVGTDGVALDRSDTYWNKTSVNLDHVQFVPKENAEAALEAYKNGEIDAVTNAEFEPLALKLLAPFQDFRQTTHSALNFYEFNTKNVPFNDRRIREALAIAIDRERLTDGELAGSAQPATSFLPLGSNRTVRLSLNVEKARGLLAIAGFPNGANFPQVRLVINRNDTQQRVARTVARMWKQNLNLDTKIIVKEIADVEAVKTAGEFDLIRRGVVLPTVDEMVSLTSVFGPAVKPDDVSPKERRLDETPQPDGSLPPKMNGKKGGPSDGENIAENPVNDSKAPITLPSEDAALYELNAIPLYFPMSYSLVKPYVRGFEISGLDAALLEDVSIDNDWQPK